MGQIERLDDTIAAISTPSGRGGIGIVRLSGKDALAIADRMFTGKGKKKPSEFRTFSVHYGEVIRDGEVIDEALLTVMRGPRSYTREDIVEISSHGGIVSLKTILTIAVRLGARLAEPGEFTKRAFLNGRIDLTQAEAVLDVIQSKTEAFLRVSTHQLKGDLSIELEKIRESLMNIYVEIEAIVNFPEEDVDSWNGGDRRGADAAAREAILGKIRAAQGGVEKLLASSEQGRILRDGIKIVICGRPNVGKSSVLNALLKHPRAIVSAVAGTTRDTIEETAQINGIPFQLVDTAGILEPRDLIEEEAVKRSHLSLMTADLVLFVTDAGQGSTGEDQKLFDLVKERDVVVVLNKCDLGGRVPLPEIQKIFVNKDVIRVSALLREGIEELEKAIVARVWHGEDTADCGLLLSNMRHINCLEGCLTAVQEAEKASCGGLSWEFVSEEIRAAVHTLDRITGRSIDSDLLERIFSQFCIGK